VGEHTDRFCSLVLERQKSKNLDYAAALREIAREFPGFAELYRSETVRRRVRFEMIGPYPVAHVSVAQKELDGLVRARMAEKNVDYSTALREIGREHVDLCEIVRLGVVNDNGRKYLA
jgi:hypothetical protein